MTNAKLLVVISATVALLAPARSTSAAEHARFRQAACPADNDRARGNVLRFLTSASFESARAQYGMAGVNPANLRVLTSPQDAAACQRLASTVRPAAGRFPSAASYYFADGFYFVAQTWVVPADQLWTGFSPLLVFKSDLTYLEAYAM
jgi:hypothetical protein